MTDWTLKAARERDKLVTYLRDMPCDCSIVETAADEIAKLRCELQKAEKDAARYRWLKEQTERTASPAMSVVAKYGLDPESSEWVNVADLDSCIDAARGGA